jgi:hypothetical protein
VEGGGFSTLVIKLWMNDNYVIKTHENFCNVYKNNFIDGILKNEVVVKEKILLLEMPTLFFFIGFYVG